MFCGFDVSGITAAPTLLVFLFLLAICLQLFFNFFNAINESSWLAILLFQMCNRWWIKQRSKAWELIIDWGISFDFWATNFYATCEIIRILFSIGLCYYGFEYLNLSFTLAIFQIKLNGSIDQGCSKVLMKEPNFFLGFCKCILYVMLEIKLCAIPRFWLIWWSREADEGVIGEEVINILAVQIIIHR